jgi:protein ImuB
LPKPAAIHVEWPDQCHLPLWFEHGGERIMIRHGKGPERIETGWWKASDGVQRDYYVLEAIDGARYWIFQTPDESWFLHGLFA